MAILKDNTANTASLAKFGGAFGERYRTASQFIPDAEWNVVSIRTSLNEDTGNPGGQAGTNYDIEVQIQGDNGSDLPDSSAIATGTLANENVNDTTNYVDNTVTFDSPVNLLNGVKYWVVFRLTSGAGDDSNYYSSQSITSSGTGAGYNDSIWSSKTSNLYYALNGTIAGVKATDIMIF